MIPNFLEQTVIHQCVKDGNLKTVDMMLKFLKNYPIDHHSRSIQELFPFFIEQSLPEFINYIDQRFLQTNQLKNISKGCLKEGISGIKSSNMWFDEEKFKNALMDEDAQI